MSRSNTAVGNADSRNPAKKPIDNSNVPLKNAILEFGVTQVVDQSAQLHDVVIA